MPGYVDIYEVSSLGNVRSLDRVHVLQSRAGGSYERRQRGKLLAPTLNSAGYRTVYLWKEHVGHRRAISNLVALSFIGDRPLGSEVCHCDGNKLNDRLSNLRYDTHQANQADRVEHGTAINGQDVPWAKLTADDVVIIRALKGKETQAAIGKRFGITQSRVSKIQRREQWKHVP